MEVESKYGDQVQIIGVPGLSNLAEMHEFVSDTGTGELVHVPDGGELWERFGVFEQRTYIYVNDDGTYEMSGYGSLEDDVRDLIAR